MSEAMAGAGDGWGWMGMDGMARGWGWKTWDFDGKSQ